jgi:hypothetical protein
MRLFLFSASIFYILGLKLISRIEIQPVFFQKAVTTEAPSISTKKSDTTPSKTKPLFQKKDSLIQHNTKNKPLTAPVKKDNVK